MYLKKKKKKPIQAPFDASAVDNMKRVADHSGQPGHIYPLAIMCHDIMPPPAQVCYPYILEFTIIFHSLFYCDKVVLQVEKEIGEKRFISFHGTGLSAAPEISFNENTYSCKSPEEVSLIQIPTLNSVPLHNSCSIMKST